MQDILLCTLNARYIHSAFGLRYLQANLGELRARSQILEFTINQNLDEVAKKILATNPKILGFGVYIWNAIQTLELIRKLKTQRPELTVILGGPEVSHESNEQEIVELADHTLRGEADVLFRQVCERLLLSSERANLPKIIDGPLPDLQSLTLPYALYSDEDLKNRVIYVEASRGCAYKCEYCLSSLDLKVRSFPIEKFLAEMDVLIERGARQFKFVDRTFNLSPKVSTQILQFFFERMHFGLFLHFEMVPDRLPEELKAWVKRFPEGSLQFEVGIQTWNPETSRLVSRKQDTKKIEENLLFLRAHTGVHIHADLIGGLPAETWESFAEGFNRLVQLGPHEVQLGILKRLRGTPIIRHDQEWQMRYSKLPPYEIQETRTMSRAELDELKRMAKIWDLVANRGYFQSTLQLLKPLPPFEWLRELTARIWSRFGRTHTLDLMSLAECCFEYLTHVHGFEPKQVALTLAGDLKIPEMRPMPPFLKTHLYQGSPRSIKKQRQERSTPKRQSRFMSSN